MKKDGINQDITSGDIVFRNDQLYVVFNAASQTISTNGGTFRQDFVKMDDSNPIVLSAKERLHEQYKQQIESGFVKEQKLRHGNSTKYYVLTIAVKPPETPTERKIYSMYDELIRYLNCTTSGIVDDTPAVLILNEIDSDTQSITEVRSVYRKNVPDGYLPMSIVCRGKLCIKRSRDNSAPDFVYPSVLDNYEYRNLGNNVLTIDLPDKMGHTVSRLTLRDMHPLVQKYRRISNNNVVLEANLCDIIQELEDSNVFVTRKPYENRQY